MTRPLGEMWFSPVFSNLLENRQENLILLGAGGLHLGLSLAGLPGWVCPIRAVTGIPCPGCGLTTAVMQLARGDALGALHTHAFAPVFLLALALMLAAMFLPEGTRRSFIAGIARLEVKTGLTSWILLALFGYWIARLPGLIN